jgi:hypothetical protein
MIVAWLVTSDLAFIYIDNRTLLVVLKSPDGSKRKSELCCNYMSIIVPEYELKSLSLMLHTCDIQMYDKDETSRLDGEVSP